MEWEGSASPLLSACTPATSSREPTRPGQSRPAGTRGATHPGGMNKPEGVVMGGGRLPSGGRARRAPHAAATVAAALTAVVAAVAVAAAAAATGAAGAPASWPPLLILLLQPPVARPHVARAASQAARRILGPLGCRPAPPRPAGPTPRPRVTPRPRPPAVDKSGLASARRAPYLSAGGFPAAWAGPGPGRHRTAGHTH